MALYVRSVNRLSYATMAFSTTSVAPGSKVVQSDAMTGGEHTRRAGVMALAVRLTNEGRYVLFASVSMGKMRPASRNVNKETLRRGAVVATVIF
jgi:hypothetical protein